MGDRLVWTRRHWLPGQSHRCITACSHALTHPYAPHVHAQGHGTHRMQPGARATHTHTCIDDAIQRTHIFILCSERERERSKPSPEPETNDSNQQCNAIHWTQATRFSRSACLSLINASCRVVFNFELCQQRVMFN